MTDLHALQWYAVQMVSPTNGHRRTAMLGGEHRTVRTRSGHVVKRRKPGTGDRVFVPEHILQKAGFATFLPVKKIWRKKHRFTAEQELVSFPLVANWMFVGWPVERARWHDLLALRVVAGVLGSGGRPIAVRPKQVAHLMKLWGNGVPPAVRRAVVQADRLAVGDDVTVGQGPFEDFKGKVVELNEAGAKVAINLFGRETPVELAFADMYPAKDACVRPAGVHETGAPGCLRCGETMVLAYECEKKHHLKCGSCGAFGALQSSSPARALSNWEAGIQQLVVGSGS
jgi:transcription antitermination factor NusG